MSTSFCWRNTRITSPYHLSSRRPQHASVDHPSVLAPHNYQPVAHSVGITITNVSSRDLVESLLRGQDVQDNLNWGNSPDYSQVTSEVIDDQEKEEKEEDAILLGYVKTTTHHVAALKDPTETQEICSICQAVFEHEEESIGTLGCGHEYHTGCIKQWLLRKKDCPMCRASVLPSYA